MKNRVRIKFDPSKLLKAVSKAERRYLFRAGGLLKTIARRSIKKQKAKSQPGTPPSSQTGNLRNAIWFDVNLHALDVVIGPRFTDMHEIGYLHEFGGTRNGAVYPARPYMGPAFDATVPQLPKIWKDLISN